MFFLNNCMCRSALKTQRHQSEELLLLLVRDFLLVERVLPPRLAGRTQTDHFQMRELGFQAGHVAGRQCRLLIAHQGGHLFETLRLQHGHQSRADGLPRFGFHPFHKHAPAEIVDT